MRQLSEALTILATSSVAKDRDAIARLEKAAQADINRILGELENQSTLAEIGLHDSLAERRNLTTRMITSAGLMCAGLSCLITIWLRPGIAIAVIPVGFVTGAATSSLMLASEGRKSNKNSL
jgi:hypothetical protein